MICSLVYFTRAFFFQQWVSEWVRQSKGLLIENEKVGESKNDSVWAFCFCIWICSKRQVKVGMTLSHRLLDWKIRLCLMLHFYLSKMLNWTQKWQDNVRCRKVRLVLNETSPSFPTNSRVALSFGMKWMNQHFSFYDISNENSTVPNKLFHHSRQSSLKARCKIPKWWTVQHNQKIRLAQGYIFFGYCKLT